MDDYGGPVNPLTDRVVDLNVRSSHMYQEKRQYKNHGLPHGRWVIRQLTFLLALEVSMSGNEGFYVKY